MFKLVVLLSFTACALGATIPSGMLPQLDGRIVGGTATTISKYPYVVSLQRSGSHSCGGSIYALNYIVTAAHCVVNVAASSLKIRAGSTDRTQGGVLVSISAVTVHPSYNANTMVNDVAVLKLATSLTKGTNIAPIALVTAAPSSGTSATVCGWGTLSSGGSLPTVLQVVTVKIVSQSQCASSTYGYGSQIKATMICATGVNKDSCQGDSGGPLAVSTGQAGIVSWGYGCAQANYPGVYSDVAALRSWIVGVAK